MIIIQETDASILDVLRVLLAGSGRTESSSQKGDLTKHPLSVGCGMGTGHLG